MPLIPEKSRLLAQKLKALWPIAHADIEFRWSGTFDNTSDGLPLIGPVPGAKGIYAAYGYGGNGIPSVFFPRRLSASSSRDRPRGWQRISRWIGMANRSPVSEPVTRGRHQGRGEMNS